MEFLLNRYRNLSVLLLVVASQLLLIAYQVKTSNDVPLLRVWAVTAVTPVERILEVVRRYTWGFVEDYVVLVNTRRENDRLRQQMGQLKLENHYLRTELSTADRAQALSVFQSRSPSKTLAARIIGNGTGANSKAVFIDRGSGNGVEGGMAVVTPDGIVGKVVAAYPTASLVLLITDANFAAGVISQKGRVHGTLKGQGHEGAVTVDYIQNEEKVDVGEWFYTSGDDRIFPKGFPVGQVSAVRNGRTVKEIYVSPSGFQGGLEEVLIVLEAVHQPIPEAEPTGPGYKLIPAPPGAGDPAAIQTPGALITDADRLKVQYRQAGQEQHHPYGEGYAAPDFTKLPGLREPAPAQTAAKPGQPQPETPAKTKPAEGDAASGPAAIAKTKPAEGDASSGTAAAAKSRPKPSAPLLVTDPTDADPNEPAILPPPRRMEAKPVLPPRPKPNVQ